MADLQPPVSKIPSAPTKSPSPTLPVAPTHEALILPSAPTHQASTSAQVGGFETPIREGEFLFENFSKIPRKAKDNLPQISSE